MVQSGSVGSNSLKSILPVGLKAPVRVAESCRVTPMLPLVGVGVVPRLGLFFAMATVSWPQALLALLLLASPA